VDLLTPESLLYIVFLPQDRHWLFTEFPELDTSTAETSKADVTDINKDYPGSHARKRIMEVIMRGTLAELLERLSLMLKVLGSKNSSCARSFKDSRCSPSSKWVPGSL